MPKNVKSAKKVVRKKATPRAAMKKTAKKVEAKVAPVLGMWKILERKKEQMKKLEQQQKEGSGYGRGGHFQPHAREHFVKFSGPRRKVG